jgi:CheY-like chemotaxis protein
VSWSDSTDQVGILLTGALQSMAVIGVAGVTEESVVDLLSLRQTCPTCKIVVIATDRMPNDQELIDSVGDAILLRKPIRGTVFHAAVRNLINGYAAVPAIPHLTASRSTAPLRVLVAEDNAVNQRVTSSMLDRLGYECTVVSNGLLALHEALSRDFDAVLMDAHMPVMDGAEATKRIREAGRRDLPIIALTASALVGDRESLLDAGMNDYLTKPVQLQELGRVLAMWTAHELTSS